MRQGSWPSRPITPFSAIGHDKGDDHVRWLNGDQIVGHVKPVAPAGVGQERHRPRVPQQPGEGAGPIPGAVALLGDVDKLNRADEAADRELVRSRGRIASSPAAAQRLDGLLEILVRQLEARMHEEAPAVVAAARPVLDVLAARE